MRRRIAISPGQGQIRCCVVIAWADRGRTAKRNGRADRAGAAAAAGHAEGRRADILGHTLISRVWRELQGAWRAVVIGDRADAERIDDARIQRNSTIGGELDAEAFGRQRLEGRVADHIDGDWHRHHARWNRDQLVDAGVVRWRERGVAGIATDHSHIDRASAWRIQRQGENEGRRCGPVAFVERTDIVDRELRQRVVVDDRAKRLQIAAGDGRVARADIQQQGLVILIEQIADDIDANVHAECSGRNRDVLADLGDIIRSGNGTAVRRGPGDNDIKSADRRKRDRERHRHRGITLGDAGVGDADGRRGVVVGDRQHRGVRAAGDRAAHILQFEIDSLVIFVKVIVADGDRELLVDIVTIGPGNWIGADQRIVDAATGGGSGRSRDDHIHTDCTARIAKPLHDKGGGAVGLGDRVARCAERDLLRDTGWRGKFRSVVGRIGQDESIHRRHITRKEIGGGHHDALSARIPAARRYRGCRADAGDTSADRAADRQTGGIGGDHFVEQEIHPVRALRKIFNAKLCIRSRDDAPGCTGRPTTGVEARRRARRQGHAIAGAKRWLVLAEIGVVRVRIFASWVRLYVRYIVIVCEIDADTDPRRGHAIGIDLVALDQVGPAVVWIAIAQGDTIDPVGGDHVVIEISRPTDDRSAGRLHDNAIATIAKSENVEPGRRRDTDEVAADDVADRVAAAHEDAVAIVVQNEIGFEYLAAANLIAAGRDDNAIAGVADIEQLVGRAKRGTGRKREQADGIAEDAHALTRNQDAAAGIGAILVECTTAVVALVVADDIGRPDEGAVSFRTVRRGAVVFYGGRDVDAIVAIAELEPRQAAKPDHVAGDEIRQHHAAADRDAIVDVAADDIAGADEIAIGAIAEHDRIG